MLEIDIKLWRPINKLGISFGISAFIPQNEIEDVRNWRKYLDDIWPLLREELEKDFSTLKPKM